MPVQTSAFVGRAGGWHDRVGSRIRFKARMNGRDGWYVGRVMHCSPTQAVIKVQIEADNGRGGVSKRSWDFPTDVIDASTVKQIVRED